MEAAVSIDNIVNPGVTIRIDNKEMKISSQMNAVKFYRPEGSSVIEVKSI